MTVPAVSARDLRIELHRGGAIVDGVSLTVAPGEVLGLVGESGSGKTTTALALLGFARPGARIVAGTVEITGVTMETGNERRARRLQGRQREAMRRRRARRAMLTRTHGSALGRL